MNHTARNRPTNRKPKATPKRRRCQLSLEVLEERCLLSSSPPSSLVPEGVFRPIGELGNNVANPTQGTPGTDLLRISPAAYANGFSTPSLPYSEGFPSPRTISNDVFNQATTLFGPPSDDIQTVDNHSLSAMAYAFGQFVDHDLDMTPDDGTEFTDAPGDFPIPADATHPSDPIGSLAFGRSIFNPTTGTSVGNPRQQINEIASYLDLSNVYGSNATVADALRTFQGGLLKTSDNGQALPYDNTTYFTPAQIAALNMQNSGPLPESDLFAAGDVRANENIEEEEFQTLFVLNHNSIAKQLATMNPTDFGFTTWNDENLYQEARKINIAEFQNIVYNEYLPDLLGSDAPQYTGYNPNVNTSIATEFSTVAFRFGHVEVNDTVERDGNNGATLSVGNIPLADDFFDANLLNPSGGVDPVTGITATGLAPLLKGSADTHAQAIKPEAVSSLRNLLFANGDKGSAEDLIARDIWRARDDGIGTYNQVAEAFGLPAIPDNPNDPLHGFEYITSNPTVQQELITAYSSLIADGGYAGDIDAFVGGIAQNQSGSSDLGALFTTIISNQFSRLENGDRFFYLNETWTPAEEQILQQGASLTDIIENNTDITNLQSDPLTFTASIGGTVSFANGGGSPGGTTGGSSTGGTNGGSPGGNGVAGVTVELEDTSGNVLATTVTSQNGSYFFNQLSGPAANPTMSPGVSHTGDYQVVLVLPQGLTQVGPSPGTIDITVGGQEVNNVNFSVTSSSLKGGSGSNDGSGTSTASPAVTVAGSSGGISSSGGTLTLASSASSANTTQTSTNTSIAMALVNSTGSGTVATSQAPTTSGQTSITSPTNSVSSPTSIQSTAALVANPDQVLPLVEPSSSAAEDTQTVSG
jgi:peroxidase